MRFVLAGIIYFFLISNAFAGVIGKVDSIGFGGQIRAETWTPLLVQITSDAAGPEEYTLQVVQHDMDGDEVVYTTPRKTINSGSQSFWLYFKPQSIDGGLPSAGSGTVSDLSKKLRVYVASADGQKRLVQISVASSMPEVLEDASPWPEKMVLCIGRRPNSVEFDKNGVLGLSEYVKFTSIEPRRLPDNPIGYQSADAIVWTDGDINLLEPAQFRALRQWVRGGGKLVVLQNPEAGRMDKLADFLPVQVGRIEEWTNRQPLQSILHPIGQPRPKDSGVPSREIDPFRNTRGPFRMARAEPLPDAIVDTWITWPDKAQTPYIARRVYGMGMVAWVAQDVSDPAIRDVSWGWPNFWLHVFDWPLSKGESLRGLTLKEITPTDDLKRANDVFRAAGAKDVGVSFVDQIDLGSKTAALISLVFLFFIGYWLIAGPGAYLVLAAKKRTHISWFIFGATAILATLLTAGVARLVLRGNAEIRHVSLVRARADGSDAAKVISRFGIYLPEDRPDTEIALNGRDPNGTAILTPLAIAPRFFEGKFNPRDSRYSITIANEDVGEQVITQVPFRSTLKKLEAEWNGAPAGRVAGTPKLTGKPLDQSLQGSLSNNTGRDLSHVLIVYSGPPDRQGHREDYVLYMRLWQKGATIDLAKAIKDADKRTADRPLTLDGEKGAFGTLDDAANNYLYRGTRTAMMDSQKMNDSSGGYRVSFPIASLYERLAPMKNKDSMMSSMMSDRAELFRRGVRTWDVSGAVAGGALVVLGQSNNDAIPLPITVEGDAPEGAGVTFWQFIVPLDRSLVNKPPTTQPIDAETEKQ